MKLLRRKCQICMHWYGAFRTHCPSCAAAPITIKRKMCHFNALTLRPMFRVDTRVIPQNLFTR